VTIAPPLPPTQPPQDFLDESVRVSIAVATLLVSILVVAASAFYTAIRSQKIISYSGIDIVPPDAPVRSMSSHDEKVLSALSSGTILLVRCAWLRQQSHGFIITRRQDMPDHAFLSPSEASQLFLRQSRLIAVISYGWLTPLHCDPDGDHAYKIIDFLKTSKGAEFHALFWDFASLMQKDAVGNRNPQEEHMFVQSLKVMAGLYASARGTAVLQLTSIPDGPNYNTVPYDMRGWPKLERYAAMIVVGAEHECGMMPRRPKLIDICTEQPVSVHEPPEPEAFERELQEAHFVGKGDREQVRDMYASFYMSIGVPERARYRLQQMKSAAHVRKRKLRQNAVMASSSSFAILLVIYLIVLLCLPSPYNTYGGVVLYLLWSTLVVGALAISPDDDFGVTVGCWLLFSVLFGFAMGCSMMIVLVFDGARVATDAAQMVIINIMFAISAASLVPSLFRRRVRMASRDALFRCWWAARFMLLGGSIGNVLTLTPMWGRWDVSDDAAVAWHNTSVICAAIAITLAILARPPMRRFIQGRMAPSSESKQAAVASLFANVGIESVVQLAEASFRLIRFDLVSLQAIPGPNVVELQDIYTMSNIAKLGEVDSVFVSHSWHDNREAKYTALEQWAVDWQVRTGSQPHIWIDIACINRDNIDQSLALLPIYTASCQYLLILVGPSYTSRLWTMIEVFCFLLMGGRVDHIIVRPLQTGWGEPTYDALRDFLCFDVKNARCARRYDTQRLLACVEAGFGTHEAFNQIIRGLLSSSTVVEDRHTAHQQSIGDDGIRKPVQMHCNDPDDGLELLS